jgi:hypothetical protein
MATFKSFNNIILDMIQQLRLTQPSLDTKPATVARDLMVDLQAQQVSEVYEALREISALQSVSNVTGQDLTNYASNYGVTRQNGTKAIGTVVFTFKNIDSDITISSGTLVRTRNGLPFSTVSTTSITTSQANSLRATATRLREQLNAASITDEFAIEASVEANSAGSIGNIASYSITLTNASDVNGVTNLSSFTGGSDLESDAALRSRILATFAGTNVGTAVGYRSVVLNLATSIDALVVEPGDPLMTRDGTVTVVNSSGDTVVSEPGTGGRVDIYIMGENLQAGTDSFVFNDLSGRSDPTDSNNDFVMGQSSLTADTTLTLNSRRVATLSEGAEIPTQPISSLVSVSGSSSGPHFVEQYTDSAGNLQGNYALTKDTGSAGGSPFGLDKFVWTSDRIELENESNTKGAHNSIDELAFTDVLKINSVDQEVQVTNENSSVSGSDRSYVTVNHTPIKTVSRVFNLTSGERYTIIDQNPDGSGTTNTSGRIQISGRTLPTASDVLQVDYIWIYPHDQYIDFDNFDPADILDEAQDSVEWGFSNYIRDETSTAILDSYNNLTVQTTYPISRILSVNAFETDSVSVGSQSSITVSRSVTNVHSVTDTTISGNPEIYNTSVADGNFSNLVITLPSDTIAQIGDSATAVYNLTDVSDVDGYDAATALNNVITLNPSTAVSSGTAVRINYVADFLNLLPSTNISALPLSTDTLNSFTGIDGYQPVQNIFSGGTVITNQRRSPSNLNVTTSGIPNSGTIRFVGTTINKTTAVFTSTSSNLDLSIPIRVAEGLSSGATVPTSIYVARVVSLEEVSLSTSNEVQSVLTDYDLTNYAIRNSQWDRENAIERSTLSRTAVNLTSTETNTDSPVQTGTILRVTFYYAKENDTENLFFSRNGTAITDKRFGHVSSINRLSGFQDSSGTTAGKILIDSFNQPAVNATYLVDYDYTAPKENERVTINFEYNKLIVDATQAIEESRPITADVLSKAAAKIELDVDAVIIVTDDFSDKETTVRQDVADNISATLNASAQGTTLDSSDIKANAYNVAGLDRIRITKFNIAGVSGTKLSISAEKSEYLASGTVTVEVEER